MDWSDTNNFLKGTINNLDKLRDPVKIASFDLDDTIIHRPKGKAASNKWKLLDSSITDKIADLVTDEYIIVIFTNQGGMSMSKNFDKPKWRKAMDDLATILMSKVKNKKYYFAVYVSKSYDLYRKPNIGLWEQMKLDLKDTFNLDKLRISKKSFFCGDAAGRISDSIFKKKMYPTSKKPGDFSDTDRKFALNIGIDFLTPDEFFLTNSPKMSYKMLGFNPTKFLEIINSKDNNKDQQLIINVDSKKTEEIRIPTGDYVFVPRKKELLLMIGQSGSGKSDFVQKYILPHGYIHINQDTCKTKAKCLAQTEEALEKHKSVVVDNTNPDILTRMAYTSMAVDNGYKHIRAIVVNTPDVIAKHLNNVRHIYTNGAVPKINKIAYNIFKKNYIKPLKSEHFDKIEIIDFVFDTAQLDDPVWRKIFLRWSEA